MQELINNILSVFNANSIAQIFGLIALSIEVISVINKDDKKLIFFQAIAAIFWVIHFLLMWLVLAVVIWLIDMIRWFAALKFPKNIKLFSIFFILYWINAVYNFESLISIFAILASIWNLYLFFFLNWKWLSFRLGLLWTTILWLSYHILNQSIWWTINETIILILHFVTIFRLYRDKIKLANNLELEPVLVELDKNNLKFNNKKLWK